MDNVRKIYLGEELRNSVRLIEFGFGEIQNIDLNNGFYHLPLQLLSSGIERFLKSYICFGYYEKHNKFPDFNTLKKFGGKNGHDIQELKKVILKDYFQLRDKNDQVLKNDLTFIQTDKQLDELLYLLSEFGKYARYHNLDIVTGKTNPSINTEELWEKFETKILKENTPLFRRFFNLQNTNDPETYDFINSKIISILERFIRSLSRQFTIVNLGKLAKQFSGEVYDFAVLPNKDFGKREYRKITTKVIETTKKPYKRTYEDDIERLSNPNFIHKLLKKENHQGEWPFDSDEAIIELRDNNRCIITIDGYDYALNGRASIVYDLELVNRTNMTIPGGHIHIHDFTKIALNLGENQK